jgi:hypothetical protein
LDLQTRKLNAIEYLIGLHDEKIFRKIEPTIIEVQKQQTVRRSVKPLTVRQLVDRANRSTKDYLSGKFKTQDQLEKNQKTGNYMKILWSDFSVEMLLEIYTYYKEKASPSIAKKIKTDF